jgi:hypothetical protein
MMYTMSAELKEKSSKDMARDEMVEAGGYYEWDGNELVLFDSEGFIVDRVYSDDLENAWKDEHGDKLCFGSDPSEQ